MSKSFSSGGSSDVCGAVECILCMKGLGCEACTVTAVVLQVNALTERWERNSELLYVSYRQFWRRFKMFCFLSACCMWAGV